MPLAFEGIRILDFSQVLAGPVASHMLGMLGAEVIKIESPGSGDQFRDMLPTDAFKTYGMSPAFMSANFGKRSVALDLRHPSAKDVVTKLIEQADVVLENFRAGSIERLGFGYDVVKQIKPNIIYCSVTGFGQQGPMRGAPAFDGAIQATSGMMSITGYPSTGPTRAGYMPVDLCTAMSTAFALSSALYRRAVTGEGQRLDVAMLDTAIYLMSPNYSSYLVGNMVGGLDGNRSPTGRPTADVFPTSDGHLQIAALSEAHCSALIKALDLAHLLDDPRFKDNPSREANANHVYETLAAATRQKSTSECLAICKEVGIPTSEIRDIPTVAADPQLAHRNIIREVPAPRTANGNGPEILRLIGAPFIAQTDGPQPSGPPPRLGEHTEAVLTELGYTSDAIVAFRNEGLFGETGS